MSRSRHTPQPQDWNRRLEPCLKNMQPLPEQKLPSKLSSYSTRFQMGDWHLLHPRSRVMHFDNHPPAGSPQVSFSFCDTSRFAPNPRLHAGKLFSPLRNLCYDLPSTPQVLCYSRLIAYSAGFPSPFRPFQVHPLAHTHGATRSTFNHCRIERGILPGDHEPHGDYGDHNHRGGSL